MSNDCHHDKNAEADQFDKFMENYFLDPNTSYLDQLTFRVDIYECNQEYVVEALFDEKQPKKIMIKAYGAQLIITALMEQTKFKADKSVERTVPFPFSISTKKITASCSNNILEIKISKEAGNDPAQEELIIICH